MPNLFHKGSITLSPKLGEATAEKENYRSTSQMNLHARILGKISSKPNSRTQ